MEVGDWERETRRGQHDDTHKLPSLDLENMSIPGMEHYMLRES